MDPKIELTIEVDVTAMLSLSTVERRVVPWMSTEQNGQSNMLHHDGSWCRLVTALEWLKKEPSTMSAMLPAFQVRLSLTMSRLESYLIVIEVTVMIPPCRPESRLMRSVIAMSKTVPGTHRVCLEKPLARNSQLLDARPFRHKRTKTYLNH